MEKEEEKIRQFFAIYQKTFQECAEELDDPDLCIEKLERALKEETVNEILKNGFGEKSNNTYIGLKVNLEKKKGLLSHWFKKKKDPSLEVFLRYLRNTGKFNKNEFILIEKLKLIRSVNSKLVSLNSEPPMTLINALIGISLLSSFSGIWIGYIWFHDGILTINFPLSLALGILIGLAIRYYWERSFGREKLLAKIREVAPWIDRPTISKQMTL